MEHNEVLTIVKTICPVIDDVHVLDDEDLFKIFRIDSVALVELVVELENRYEIEIPLEEMKIENFRTTKAIIEMLYRVK